MSSMPSFSVADSFVQKESPKLLDIQNFGVLFYGLANGDYKKWNFQLKRVLGEHNKSITEENFQIAK